MIVLFVLIFGVIIDTVQPDSIGSLGLRGPFEDKWQNKGISMYPSTRENPGNEEFQEFYSCLSAISSHLRTIYTPEFWGNSYSNYDDFMRISLGIDFGSQEFIRELAIDLSELSTMNDVIRLFSNRLNMNMSTSDMQHLLRGGKEIRRPYAMWSRKLRNVIKKIYRWVQKTSFPHDFPIQHTSVEEAEGLMAKSQVLAVNVEAIFYSAFFESEGRYRAINSTVLHEYAVQLLECESFAELVTAFMYPRFRSHWQEVQQILELLVSRDYRRAYVGLTWKLPKFLELLDRNGILDIEPIDDYRWL